MSSCPSTKNFKVLLKELIFLSAYVIGILVICVFILTHLLDILYNRIQPLGDLLNGLQFPIGCTVFYLNGVILAMLFAWYAFAMRNFKAITRSLDIICLLLIAAVAIIFLTSFVKLGCLADIDPKPMVQRMQSYNENPSMTAVIDFMQEKFRCCGTHSYLDWREQNVNGCLLSGLEKWRCGIPETCLRPYEISEFSRQISGSKDATIIPEAIPSSTVFFNDFTSNFVMYPEGNPDDIIYTVGCLRKINEFQDYVQCMIIIYTSMLGFMQVILRTYLENTAHCRLCCEICRINCKVSDKSTIAMSPA